MSFQILKDCWCRYQVTVKDAKRQHLSNIILFDCDKPLVLFNFVDIVLNAPQTACIDPFPEVCERFLKTFFVDKVTNTRVHISPSAFGPSVSVPCSAASEAPTDPVLPQFCKDIVSVLGTLILAHVNSSLPSGAFP